MHKSNSIILLFSLLFMWFCFTSCENFLKATSVKDEIEKSIEYANAPSYEIRVQCDEGTGTILTETIFKKKVSDVFSIEFQIAEGFQFDTWKIYTKNSDGILTELSSEYIEIKDYNKVSKDGIYKVTVKFVKATDNIVIKPVCLNIPKITEVYPPDSLTGCDQDTMLKISFNKPMNTQSFLDSNGDFTCISISDHLVYYDYAHNKDNYYYGIPFFSEDAKTLYIPVIKEKHILPLDGDLTKKDLELNLDFSNITDQDGLALNVEQTHIYRINQGVDNTKPVFTSAKLYSTSDKSDPHYKELSSLDFSSWSQNPDGSYEYGTFSQNLVRNSVYFELSGYDAKPGISGVKVVETYYRYVSGESVVGVQPLVQVFQANMIGENLYSLDYSTINNDGIIKLEIAFMDYAQNDSEYLTFYILKDTSTDISVITFDEVSKGGKILRDTNFMEWIPNDDGTQSVTLTLKENCFDTIYDNLKLEYDVELYYDIAEGGKTYTAIKTVKNSRIKYKITKRPEEYTYVIIHSTDKAGNTYNYTRCILPVLEFDKDCYIEKKENGYNYISEVIPHNSTVYSLVGKPGNYTILYRWEKNSEYHLNNLSPTYNNNSGFVNDSIRGGVLTLHVVSAMVYGVGFTSAPYEMWLSPKSFDNFTINVKDISSSSPYYWNQEVTYNGISLSSGNNEGYDEYINTPISVTTEPVLNSDTYKVSLNNYKKAGVTGVDYRFKFDSSTSSVIISDKDVVSLPSYSTYKLYIIATNSNHDTFISPQVSFYENENTETKDELELSMDLTPPEIPVWNGSNRVLYWCNSSNMFFTPLYRNTREYFPHDNEGGVGLYGKEEDIFDVEYCFIPLYSTSILEYPYYSEAEIRKNYSSLLRTVSYKNTDNKLCIPMGDLPEGLYTLCRIVKDKNGNSAIQCERAYNKLFGIKCDSYGLEGVDNSWFYIKSKYNDFDTEKYDKKWIDRLLWSYNESKNVWELHESSGNDDLSPRILKTRFSTVGLTQSWVKVAYVYDDYTTNSGFFDVIYFYFPYEYSKLDENAQQFICRRKNYLELANGYEVFADAPVLAHTFWCYKKLSEDNSKDDVQIWLNKGMETGVIQSDGSLTYTQDNYSDIPEGAWYTTVFHFVDGTVLMTEVRQK